MAPSPEEALQAAEMEMEFRVALFNRMGRSCFDKCVNKQYKEGDLNIGESACVDRCSSKYWQVVQIVGQMLQSSQQQ